MKAKITIKYYGEIRDLNNMDNLQLIEYDDDVQFIYDYFGSNENVICFDSFFVEIVDGDYNNVFGFYGNIPYNNKPVYLITREFI